MNCIPEYHTCGCVKSMDFLASIPLALNLNGGLHYVFPKRMAYSVSAAPFSFHRHFLFRGSESGFVVQKAVPDLNRAW